MGLIKEFKEFAVQATWWHLAVGVIIGAAFGKMVTSMVQDVIISTGKYADVLMEAFGPRLHFPSEFAGRGDVGRGGLMLRCVRAMQELRSTPLAGAVRRGKRPAKLEPLRLAA